MGSLFAGFVFGICGMSLLAWGRKQGNVKTILIAIALMVYPYFIANVYLLWGVGVALLGAAYATR